MYLLLDAARQAGKSISIVYSPGHSFISFLNDSGIRYYWETTANHNHGDLADLSQGIYKKSLNHFDYIPYGSVVAEKMYPVLQLLHLPKEKQALVLHSTDDDIIHSPQFTDYWFMTQSALSKRDVAALVGLVQNDTASFTKRFALANYYIKHGDSERANYYLNQVSSSQCYLGCMKYMRKTSVWGSIDYHVATVFYFCRAEVSLCFVNRYLAVNFLFFGVLYVFFRRKSRNQHRQGESADDQ